MASLMRNQECCQAIESAPSLSALADILNEYPHLLISKEGISAIVRSIPNILRRDPIRGWDLRFLHSIFNLVSRLRWDYHNLIPNEKETMKDIGYDQSSKDWPIHVLRAYMQALCDQTNGECFINRDMFTDPAWEEIKREVDYESPYSMLAWIPTVIRYDYSHYVHDPYRQKFITHFLPNEPAMKQFFLILADTCIPMEDAFETCTVMAKIAWNNCDDEKRAEVLGYEISPFLEKCLNQDVGWLEEEIHRVNIHAEGIPHSILVMNCQNIMVHMSNIIGDPFAAENYFFEIINELSSFYPTYKAREDTAARFERYFGDDTWAAMADITSTMVNSFGPLSNYRDRRPLEQAERRAGIRLEGILRNLRLSHPDIPAEVYKLFISATIKCMGRGFRGAADGMQLYSDAMLDAIFKEDAVVLESNVDYMDLMIAMEGDWEDGFKPAEKKRRDDIEEGMDGIDNADSNTGRLSLHEKSGASSHKAHDVMNSGAQAINRAYKKYKDMETSVDKTLTGIANGVKKMIEGDQNTILIEGKQFSVVGLIKKVILTVGLFNFGKIKAILMLICGKRMRSKARKAERIKLIAELETELEIIEEKIRDATGDDNREAKYAMMRTRAAIKEALTRLKYSTDAAKAASNVKNSYLPKIARSAVDGAARAIGAS